MPIKLAYILIAPFKLISHDLTLLFCSYQLHRTTYYCIFTIVVFYIEVSVNTSLTLVEANFLHVNVFECDFFF